jgi:uncharacterized protein CbrC (UPF0167 family)
MTLTHRDLHAILAGYPLPATYQATIETDTGPDPEGTNTVMICERCKQPTPHLDQTELGAVASIEARLCPVCIALLRQSLNAVRSQIQNATR